MQAILSIKPAFSEKIFSGEKEFEFRRTIFKDRQKVKRVLVYASSPVSKIIGTFEIENILDHKLDQLWRKTKHKAGIDKIYYEAYFDGKEMGYTIQIKNAQRYKRPVCIKEKYGLRAPQSFVYVKWLTSSI